MTEQIAFINKLAALSASLKRVVDEHLSDQYGELLPHVAMAEITRWLVSRFVSYGPTDPEILPILYEIESSFGGKGEIDELIIASMLENLPSLGEEGEEIKKILGKNLRQQLQKM